MTKRFKYQTDSVKHLGINIDKNLFRKHQLNKAALKSSNVNAMLSKQRDYVDIKTQ